MPRVGNTKESQGEETGENKPDNVAGDEDAAVADQVVLQLVVAGKGGEGTQAKLEGEDHLRRNMLSKIKMFEVAGIPEPQPPSRRWAES